MEKIGGIQAIKRFFEADGGRKIEMSEFKALSRDERIALARLCCEAMGIALDETPAV